MSTKLDWRKARKFKSHEAKYAHGTVLNNGAVVHHPARDVLDMRARVVERWWGKVKPVDRPAPAPLRSLSDELRDIAIGKVESFKRNGGSFKGWEIWCAKLCSKLNNRRPPKQRGKVRKAARKIAAETWT